MLSEEEGDMVSMVALDNLDGLLFKGSSTELFPFLLIYNKLQNNPCQFDCAPCLTDKENEKMCCIFSGLAEVLKPKTNAMQSKIHQK